MVGGDDLRGAMRRFASGVAVATCEVDGMRYGITVGSLVSLSLEPPLVGISIGHDSSFHTPLREAGGFALSLLGGDQRALAQHFARSGTPPLVLWQGIALREPERGTPLLADALAWLECRTRAECEAGDHTFFVADVLSIELGRDDRALAYVGGEYRGV